MSFEENNILNKLNEIGYSSLPDGWNLMRVEDITAQMKDAPFGAKLKSKDYVDYGIPVVQGRNIKNNKFEWNNKLYTSDKKKDELKNHLCYEGELVFPKVGTIGGCAILPKIDGQIEYVLSTNMMKVRANSTISDIKYIYYYFSNPLIQRIIKQRSTTSVQPVFNFTSLKKFPIVVPGLTEQKSIVAVLSSIDEKIELNNAINKNLEEMAQALFKRWFIDFEFPNENGEPYKSSGGEFEESELGLIPKGWRVANLDEILEFNPKRSLSKKSLAPYVEMKSVPGNYARISTSVLREYSSGTRFSNGDVLLARITPCLENGKTAYVDILENGQVGWGSTEFIVLRSNKKISPIFTYFLSRSEGFRSHAITSMTGSSGRQRVPEASLRNYRIPIPSEISLFDTFGEIAQSSLDSMKKNDEESLILSQIRDSLLPKLMSGEIRVLIDEQEIIPTNV